MRNYLRSGEIAHLLGITTKTIRHYHKVGLIGEPMRTDAGYRLYSASDVLRLLRIRRLQALGLSLVQIKEVLRSPEEERPLRRVLEQVADEIDEQMRQLEKRRERLHTLLAKEAFDALDDSSGTPEIVELVRARLAEQGIVPDEAVWEQDRAVFGALDELHLPEDAQRQLQEAVRRALDDPEQVRRIAAIGERFATLASEAADSPQVDCLVEEALHSGWLDQLRPFYQHFYLGSAGSSADRDILSMLLSELVTNTLSPAQQRFLQRIQAHQPPQPAQSTS